MFLGQQLFRFGTRSLVANYWRWATVPRTRLMIYVEPGWKNYQRMARGNQRPSAHVSISLIGCGTYIELQHIQKPSFEISELK